MCATTATPQGHAGRGGAGLVAAGTAMVGVTYGLARYAFGLFVPTLRSGFDLGGTELGYIAACAYLGYCGSIAVSSPATARFGPRRLVATCGAIATLGMVIVAVAPHPAALAAGILVAGVSTGLVSPPLAEAVASRLDGSAADRAQTVINAGTGIGVAVSGPVVLLAGQRWRLAWLGFALMGLLVTVWTARTLPEREPSALVTVVALSPSWVWSRRPLRLFASALLLGFSSAAYWTFGRDVVTQAGATDRASTLLWMTVGVAGLAGGLGGRMVAGLGMGRSMVVTWLVLALGSAMLVPVSHNLLAVLVSGGLFGGAFIMASGLFLIWSVDLFAERPSGGLALTFLLIAAGQMIGAPVSGACLAAFGAQATFVVFSAVALSAALIRPVAATRRPPTGHTSRLSRW